MSKVESKMSCVLWLGGSLLVAAILVAAVALPWWMKMNYYADITDTAVERISRYQRLMRSKPQLEQQQKVLQDKLRKRNYFIVAESSELAAADLQNKAKKFVVASGGSLMSTQYLGLNKDNPRVIQVKVRMKGDVKALSSVLFDLENAKPILKVDNLAVVSRRSIKGRGSSRVEGYILDVTFVVSGYLAGAQE